MLTDKQIEIATEWWSRVIINPKFDMMGDSRERDPASARVADFAEPMMAMLAARHRPTEEAASEFRERLAHVLRTHTPHCLATDYGPDHLLLEAAGNEIDSSTFPIKTVMWFGDGGVQLKYGYGAPQQELLAKTVQPARAEGGAA